MSDQDAETVRGECACPCHRKGDAEEFRCCISYPSLCDRPRGWHLPPEAGCSHPGHPEACGFHHTHGYGPVAGESIRP